MRHLPPPTRDESVHRPFLCLLRMICTRLGMDSDRLRVGLSLPRSAFLAPTTELHHLLRLQPDAVAAAPLRGEHPECLHGAALLPLQWDLQQSSPRPVSRQVRGLHLHIYLKLPTAPDEVDHLACFAVLDPAAFRCEVHVVASSQQVADCQ